MLQRAERPRAGMHALALALVLVAACPALAQNTTGNLNGNFNTFGDNNGNTNGGDSQARRVLGCDFNVWCSALSGASADTPCTATAKELLFHAAVAPGVCAPEQAAACEAARWTLLTLVWGVCARWSAGPATTSLRSRCAPPPRACTPTGQRPGGMHGTPACICCVAARPAVRRRLRLTFVGRDTWPCPCSRALRKWEAVLLRLVTRPDSVLAAPAGRQLPGRYRVHGRLRQHHCHAQQRGQRQRQPQHQLLGQRQPEWQQRPGASVRILRIRPSPILGRPVVMTLSSSCLSMLLFKGCPVPGRCICISSQRRSLTRVLAAQTVTGSDNVVSGNQVRPPLPITVQHNPALVKQLLALRAFCAARRIWLHSASHLGPADAQSAWPAGSRAVGVGQRQFQCHGRGATAIIIPTTSRCVRSGWSSMAHV